MDSEKKIAPATPSLEELIVDLLLLERTCRMLYTNGIAPRKYNKLTLDAAKKEHGRLKDLVAPLVNKLSPDEKKNVFLKAQKEANFLIEITSVVDDFSALGLSEKDFAPFLSPSTDDNHVHSQTSSTMRPK